MTLPQREIDQTTIEQGRKALEQRVGIDIGGYDKTWKDYDPKTVLAFKQLEAVYESLSKGGDVIIEQLTPEEHLALVVRRNELCERCLGVLNPKNEFYVAGGKPEAKDGDLKARIGFLISSKSETWLSRYANDPKRKIRNMIAGELKGSKPVDYKTDDLTINFVLKEVVAQSQRDIDDVINNIKEIEKKCLSLLTERTRLSEWIEENKTASETEIAHNLKALNDIDKEIDVISVDHKDIFTRVFKSYHDKIAEKVTQRSIVEETAIEKECISLLENLARSNQLNLGSLLNRINNISENHAAIFAKALNFIATNKAETFAKVMDKLAVYNNTDIFKKALKLINDKQIELTESPTETTINREEYRK